MTPDDRPVRADHQRAERHGRRPGLRDRPDRRHRPRRRSALPTPPPACSRIPICRAPRDYVVLFRQELVRSVRWAGDPHKPVEYGPNGPRLTPRESFEEWKETVAAAPSRSRRSELRVAETLRATLIEVVLRLADEASVERQARERAAGTADRRAQPPRAQHPGVIRGLIRQSKPTPGPSVEDFVTAGRRPHPCAGPRAQPDHRRPLGAGAAAGADRGRGRRLPRRARPTGSSSSGRDGAAQSAGLFDDGAGDPRAGHQLDQIWQPVRQRHGRMSTGARRATATCCIDWRERAGRR